MKKYITVTTCFAAGTLFSNAAFVWTGAESTDWATQGNWELTDGTTWPSAGNGPQTPSSNAWAELLFDGTKFQQGPTAPATLEGWNTKFNLINGADITLNNFSFNKWLQEAAGQSYINVDETSKLTLGVNSNFQYFSANNIPAEFNIKSYEGLTLTKSVWSDGTSPQPDFKVNLFDKGSVKANWSLSGNVNIVFSGNLVYSEGVGYTLGEISSDGKYQLVTRTLWVNNHDDGGNLGTGHNFSAGGIVLIASDSVLTASADDMGKYFITKETTGTGSSPAAKYVVSYVQAIPEPSMFGLLAGMGALALVASRRRRK